MPDQTETTNGYGAVLPKRRAQTAWERQVRCPHGGFRSIAGSSCSLFCFRGPVRTTSATAPCPYSGKSVHGERYDSRESTCILVIRSVAKIRYAQLCPYCAVRL